MSDLPRPLTPREERKLLELQQRKEDHAKMLRDRVVALVDEFFFHGIDSRVIQEYLIDNADAVIEVLAPFRKGIDQ